MNASQNLTNRIQFIINTNHISSSGIKFGDMTQSFVEDFNINEFQGSKHSEVRWIEESEIDQFSEKAVDDFKDTLNIVFEKLKEKKIDE